MTFRISLIGILLLGSIVAWKSDAGYGFLVILLGLIFWGILQYWNNKNNKPPKDSDPLYTDETPLGIGQ